MATERTINDVSPQDGDWAVRRRGADRAAAVVPNKDDAVARAKELAKDAPLGQVVIRRKDGSIEIEHTYRKDPYPPKG